MLNGFVTAFDNLSQDVIHLLSGYLHSLNDSLDPISGALQQTDQFFAHWAQSLVERYAQPNGGLLFYEDAVGILLTGKAFEGVFGFVSGLSKSGETAVAEEAQALETGLAKFVCFPAGTLVATEEGLTPVEAVQALDRVWAFDLRDGQWKLRRVVETHEHDYQGDLVSISVASETVEATSRHPFWVVEGQGLQSRPRPEHVPEVAPQDACVCGRWVAAGDVQVGDVLLLRDGRFSPVTRLRWRRVRQQVYNLHVEELNSYAVGTSQVLVHNKAYNLQARVLDMLAPGGRFIGTAGSKPSIRVLSGQTFADAQAFFDNLALGGTVVSKPPFLGFVELPGGGTIGLRTVMARSPGTIATIDVNVPGLPPGFKIKFNPNP